MYCFTLYCRIKASEAEVKYTEKEADVSAVVAKDEQEYDVLESHTYDNSAALLDESVSKQVFTNIEIKCVRLLLLLVQFKC